MNGNTIIQNKNLNILIRRTVLEVVQEVLADPDYGLVLRPSFIKRLKKSIQSQKSQKTVPFAEILKKYQK